MDKGFSSEKLSCTHAIIQWKGTDVCMDFKCECGADFHIDASFAYTVECDECHTIWEMPDHVFPRKACDETPQYWKENPVRPYGEDHAE